MSLTVAYRVHSEHTSRWHMRQVCLNPKYIPLGQLAIPQPLGPRRDVSAASVAAASPPRPMSATMKKLEPACSSSSLPPAGASISRRSRSRASTAAMAASTAASTSATSAAVPSNPSRHARFRSTPRTASLSSALKSAACCPLLTRAAPGKMDRIAAGRTDMALARLLTAVTSFASIPSGSQSIGSATPPAGMAACVYATRRAAKWSRSSVRS
mmetsp:Transcript_29454/g.77198  ORF Transcript_29454/g.77198 Transcript_29454/m.77198 type:complete len:213 (-) Transcript_29454:13-651(-)